MTVPKHQIRAKAPKSKAGCKTCRLRHIRCDESKPACQKCVLSGWSCDGYVVYVGSACKSNNPDTTILPTDVVESACGTNVSQPWYMPLIRLSYFEGLAFTFFRHHTAHQLQSSLQSQLWDRWAMQVSHHEPTVLHGMIAVGALHQARSEFDNAPLDIFGTPSLQHLALKHYSKAVAELRSRMEESKDKLRTDIVLLACLLFIGFEMLQHDFPVAMDHLRLGLKIVSDNTAVVLKSAPEGPMDEIVGTLVRLDYAAPMFGRRSPLVDLIHSERTLSHQFNFPASFNSVTQARTHIDILASGVFRLQGDLLRIAEHAASLSGNLPLGKTRRQCYVQTLSKSVDLGSDSLSIDSRKYALVAALAAFWRATEALAVCPRHSTDRAVMAIRIQLFLVFFTVTNCREKYEMVCDAFNNLFESIVNLIERYIHWDSQSSCTPRKRTLTLETNVIPTIFLIASKCREPVLRRRAVRLLRDGCKQEAIWDGTPFATFMQRLVELEEAQTATNTDIGAVSGSEITQSAGTRHISTVPEQARFADVVVADGLQQGSYGQLVCARYCHETNGMIELTEHEVDISSHI